QDRLGLLFGQVLELAALLLPRHEVLDALRRLDLRGDHFVLSRRYHLADPLMLPERIEALFSPGARSSSPTWQFSKSSHNFASGRTLFKQRRGPGQVRRRT